MSSESDKPKSPPANDRSQDDSNDDSGTLKMPRYSGKGDDQTVAGSDLPLTDDEQTKLMPAYQPQEADKAALPDTIVTPSGETPTVVSSLDVEDTVLPETMATPPAQEATIASSPDLTDSGPDPTVVSSKPARPEVEKPTKVSPEPGKTKTDQDPTATMTDTTKGKILQNRYQLAKILGQGGFGAAYLAEDIKLQRRCVVKQMLTPKGISAEQLALYRANFEREAKLLVQLNDPGHPNIPEIYDYFTDASGNYLVMKFIEGLSLKDVVDQSQGSIPWREAVRYVIDMCDALDYMHSHGSEPIMHRDIKPPNILLGNDNRVWLLDFGLAKADLVEGAGGAEASMAAGSLGYTPLEQWVGKAVPASDIYALGATLHHLVTGSSPAQAYGGKFNVTKLKALHGQFEPVRKVDKGLPRALEEVIVRATAPEPEQRLTALQFKQELEALISGAQAAALYTFKSGESAKTVRDLVDLCERYRSEAKEYLYRGDFQRWFRMVNRNDLADAAEQAVKRGKNQKDGLEKFLKLIMPNLALRRLSKAGRRLVVGAVVIGLIAVATVALIVVGGSYVAKSFVQQSIGSVDWDFYALDPDSQNTLSEKALNQNAQQLAGAYLDDLDLDIRSPDKVDINGSWSGLKFNIPVTLQLQDGKPRFSLTDVNDIPLSIIGDNLSQGINGGIDEAFQQSPFDFSSLQVEDDKIVVQVAESTQSGRPPLPTATPAPSATPTATPVPSPTPTPEGLALVTIFNQTGQDIILDIEGEILEIAADDSKAIEKQPGDYNYTVTFKDTGAIGAEGQKTWTVQTYRWRIGQKEDE